ncbi:cation:proton antiporter [Naumannella halotolerans]|uniref:Kef-type K+ transport system membrane component KefB n=1 Tax=Naumannella halotolerans TaxID=993414 RepID=A0A4R7J196_9ACTN|nr:cation:proton antiporter [Naumannella halotolerans]TDT30097.1 Kef-type K+ transport system membrane component KefB [Naumannella halotolerans]
MKGDTIFFEFGLALAVILLVCAVCGSLARYVGQPRVVGEMIAGVSLGPSLFGRFFPDAQQQVFPDDLMSTIYVLSQLGLVIFMFTIGLEFDTSLLKQKAKAGVAVSVAGLAAPMLLGALVAIPLVAQGGQFFSSQVPLPVAMFILGAALATTAFPMLARILQERRLGATPLGTLALSAGAVDDAVAWLFLAVVLAIVSGNVLVAITAVVGGLIYVVVMITFGRRALNLAASHFPRVNDATLICVLVLIVVAALYTNTVGIHSIFGGFVLGIAMPRKHQLNERLRAKIQPAVKALLLPLFFVYSGLNTELGLVNTPTLWAVAALVFVASVLAKGVACYTAARACKVPRREAMAIGSLMNARGLMELILLNIVLSAGLITPTLFTILVLMAIVTTLMASPLFNYFYGRFLPADHEADRKVVKPTATFELPAAGAATSHRRNDDAEAVNHR